MGYSGYLPLSLLAEFEAANCFHLLLRWGELETRSIGQYDDKNCLTTASVICLLPRLPGQSRWRL